MYRGFDRGSMHRSPQGIRDREGEARYVVVLASAVQAGDGHQFCFQRDQLHPADWNSGFLQPARNRKRPELAQIFSGVLMVHSGKHLERYGSSS